MKLLDQISNVAFDEPQVGVALGQIPGIERFRKFGMNNDVPSTGSEEIWPVGTVRVLPAAAGVCAVVSSSAADDADPAGTGAWTVTIEGLDANYMDLSETVSLNGTTPVNTSASFLRVNRAYIVTGGTGETNAGNITISIGGDTQAYLEAGEGQTHQTHYTVPANKSVVVTNYEIAVGRMAGSTDIQIRSEIRLFNANPVWRTLDDQWLYGPAIFVQSEVGVLVPSKTEIRQTVTSTATTQVSSTYTGYLVNNAYLQGKNSSLMT